MTKEVLEKAKRIADDIKAIETAIEYFKKGTWAWWFVNDSTTTFHFAFMKNYGTNRLDRIDLPTWLNEKIIALLESNLQKAKEEFEKIN